MMGNRIPEWGRVQGVGVEAMKSQAGERIGGVLLKGYFIPLFMFCANRRVRWQEIHRSDLMGSPV